MASTIADTAKPAASYQPSETAVATAFMRALAAHDEREEIKGADYLAEVFLPQDRKDLLKDAATRHWVIKNKLAPGMYEFMIARTAFFDGVVQKGLRENIPQIVLLGAGYDSRPYRFADLIRGTLIFEIDTESTQARKREILRQAGVPIPRQLSFVPLDLTSGKLEVTLPEAGFKRDQAALFVWEGVTYYLSAASVDRTLSAIRSLCPPGSSIWFDYASLSPEALEEEGVRQVREILKSDHPAEPARFGIPAGTIDTFLAERGYTVGEHIGPREMESRYLVLRDGSPAGKLPGLFYFVQAVVSR